MAITVKKNAPGDRANTGMPKSVPPVTYKNPSPNAKDFAPRYGTNLDPSPSSLTPGHKSTDGTSLADDMKRAQDDGEGVLDAIIKGGAHSIDMGPHGDLSWQTRSYDPNANVPTHDAMRSRAAGDGSPGGTIPSKCGFQEFDPKSIRKPGQ